MVRLPLNIVNTRLLGRKTLTERAMSSNEKRSRTIRKVCEVGEGWNGDCGARKRLTEF